MGVWAAIFACVACLGVLLGSPAAGQAEETPCAPAPIGAGVGVGNGFTKVFEFNEGAAMTIRVPAGIEVVTVDAEGGHGGSAHEAAAGGQGGGVQAKVRGLAGKCLEVWVGGYGGREGGQGWADGGRGGAKSTSGGNDGRGGGGASAVIAPGGVPIVVAGGGGGGGGDSASSGNFGGAGGAGGHPAFAGISGFENDQSGGCGGCRGSDRDGSAGTGAVFFTPAGAGGGGGAGYSGGRGGLGGAGRWAERFSGGGGGGGGLSFGNTSLNGSYDFFTSTRACPATGTAPPTCNGVVTISWELPEEIAAASGDDQRTGTGEAFAQPLRAKVIDAAGKPVAGVAVRFTAPADGASGTFPHSAATATASTDANGIATAPTVTADATAGAWAVEATIASSRTAAYFSLTNLAQRTKTTVSSTVDPSEPGEPVSFRAQVAADAGPLQPAGEVRFILDGQLLGTPVPLDGAGAAVSPSATPALGEHEVEALYEGDAGLEASSGKTTQQVVQGVTASAVTSSLNPSSLGEAVSFTATVKTPSDGSTLKPTGTVQFRVGGTDLGAPVALDASGSATSLSTSSLPVGEVPVVAIYSGDANFKGSEGRTTQSVGADATATEVGAAANPAFYGDPLSLVATVRARAGSEAPSGSVVLRVDQMRACEAELEPEAPPTLESVASCTPEQSPAPGPHELEAVYAANADFQASNGTAVEQIAPARTGTELAVGPEPAAFGAPATLRATVAALLPGGGVPAGGVSFLVDGVDVSGAIQLDGQGVATAGPLGSLAAGGHVLEALYEGSDDHLASRGAAPFRIERAATAVKLSSSENPAGPDRKLRFGATVAAAAPSAATPSGAVQFVVDGENVGGPVALQDGFASSDSLGPLAFGSHEVFAYYSGDESFASSAARLDQRIATPQALAGAPHGDAAPLQPPAPRLRLLGKRLPVSASGRAVLVLRCSGPAGTRCRSPLTLRGAGSRRLGQARVAIRAGRKGRIAMWLAPAAARRLSQARRLRAQLAIGAGHDARRVVLLGATAPQVSVETGVADVHGGRADLRLFCHAAAKSRCRVEVGVFHGGRRLFAAALTLPGRRHGTVRLRHLSTDHRTRVRVRILSVIPVGRERLRATSLELIPAGKPKGRR